MFLTKNYNRLPVNFKYGKGAFLYDDKNEPFLDLLSGVSVCNLGYAHPKITEVIQKQAGKLLHVSNLYRIEVQEKLAEKLCELTQTKGAFFCNSGSEANETAIKAVRLYAYQHQINQPKILVFNNAFHGRSLSTLSASDNPTGQIGFEPLLPDFVRAPINDIDAIKKIAEKENVVAVLFEVVQGEGGINIMNNEFLQSLEALAKQKKWLLIADEIQCGMGRTGHWFGYQSANIAPDLVTLAKGLGNGVPVGVCLFNDKTFDLLSAGQHGSTFGGNPLACRVALEVIDVIENDHLIEQVNTLAELAAQFFSSQLKHLSVRQKGLMIGIEYPSFSPHLVEKILNDHHVLVNVIKNKIIRLLPPFVIQPSDLLNGLDAIQKTIKKYDV